MRKRKQQQRGLFDATPGSDPQESPGFVSHYQQHCPLCGAKGMHYFHGDGTKPIESWCGHCSTWSRLIDGQWLKCEPAKKNAGEPGPSG